MAHELATVDTFAEKLAQLRKTAHKYPVFVVWTGMQIMNSLTNIIMLLKFLKSRNAVFSRRKGRQDPAGNVVPGLQSMCACRA